MKTRTYLWSATAVSAAGVSFSGYLSAVRALSGTCAWNDPCPFFFGQPACYTGFALFTALFVVSLASLAARVEAWWPAAINLLVGAAGVVFAVDMSVVELSAAHQAGYAMGLPTCAYGAVFYAAMATLSAIALWKRAPDRGRTRVAATPQRPVHA